MQNSLCETLLLRSWVYVSRARLISRQKPSLWSLLLPKAYASFYCLYLGFHSSKPNGKPSLNTGSASLAFKNVSGREKCNFCWPYTDYKNRQIRFLLNRYKFARYIISRLLNLHVFDSGPKQFNQFFAKVWGLKTFHHFLFRTISLHIANFRIYQLHFDFVK